MKWLSFFLSTACARTCICAPGCARARTQRMRGEPKACTQFCGLVKHMQLRARQLVL